ncbi:MAG TPA: hypothetical protein VNZ58_09300 [Thermomicrobiales bacterium]|nr:hypothetical protein [Thermomicrobiales bacterium]
MVTVKLQRKDDQWVVILPNDEIDRLGLNDGQSVEVQINPALEASERLRRIDAIMDDVVVEYREAFEYLAR